jgi:hyperosmotically inducible protein
VKNEMTVASTPEKTERTEGQKIDDASVIAQVKTALLTHRSTSSVRTKIETRNGEVTLTGIAKNEAEKVLVTKLVTDIQGVSSVKNLMTVEEQKTK